MVRPIAQAFRGQPLNFGACTTNGTLRRTEQFRRVSSLDLGRSELGRPFFFLAPQANSAAAGTDRQEDVFAQRTELVIGRLMDDWLIDD
jgi:hypothetical protein